jgi:anti-sigma factor ChrR (cupin superfamily)
VDPRLETERTASAAQTLGDVLYARPEGPLAPEDEWANLVRRVAAGEVAALHGLYDRAGRLVFVLAQRITGSRHAAEEATVEVFADLWRRAWAYQASDGTVLAWIMNQARSRAREQARYATLSHSCEPAGPGTSDSLLPGPSVQARIARRIAVEDGAEPAPPPPARWAEPAWERVAQGISCKLLANDTERERVSMLVRLDPQTEYPPHTHAGLEELHLLDGDVRIDGRELRPGDYNRAEAETSDARVRSEGGCTCVLITSTDDKLL